ncbi:MAG TPA: LysR family transcriptional regulator, partial [Steroidobacteraceae bacterium]|nr:LysR family transcriptional regulator [Steroidobacteraceae bacterium]
LAMQVFARVVETGALARAADSLRIPKATATTLIQQLERSLGVKLLNRTTRRVSVTTEGAAYYPRCVSILEEVRESEEALQRGRTRPQGPLRVEAPTLIARMVIVPALPAFFARYPQIELSLGCSERHADLIEEGIDCAVWAGEIEDANLIARPAGLLYLGTCAAPAYLSAHGTPHHPDELGAHRCINHFSPRTGKAFDWVFAKDGVRIQSSLHGHVALDDENSYVAAAEAGLGIAQIPAFVLKESMERGVLDLVLGDWFPEPAALSVVYPQSRHLSGKIRVFADWIAGLFAEHDGIQLRSTLRAPTRPVV